VITSSIVLFVVLSLSASFGSDKTNYLVQRFRNQRHYSRSGQQQ